MNSPRPLERLLSCAVVANVSAAVANCVLLGLSLTMPSLAVLPWMAAITLWAMLWCFVSIAIYLRLREIRRELQNQIASGESWIGNSGLPTLAEMRANRIKIMTELERLDRWREAGRPGGSTPSGTVG